MARIFLSGSLRNPRIPEIAQSLREGGHIVFDDWFAGGPEADDWWQKYEADRGRTYPEALGGYAANHILSYDRHHIDCSDAVVLVLPCGPSGHLELGYAIGRGIRGIVLMPEPPIRWDVMYRLADAVVFTVADALVKLKEAL